MSELSKTGWSGRRTLAIAATCAVVAIVAAVVIITNRGGTAAFEPPASFKAAVLRDAILGAQKTTFDKSLGHGTVQNQMMGDLTTYGYARCPSDGTDQFSVTFAGDVAIAIAWTACGTEPSSDQALALAKQMLPKDAVASSGSSTRFTSSTLAQTVDRSWFEDCSGNDVAAGIISMSATTAFGFDVTVGTCPNSA